MEAVETGELDIIDIIPVDQNIRTLCFKLMSGGSCRFRRSKSEIVEDFPRDEMGKIS